MKHFSILLMLFIGITSCTTTNSSEELSGSELIYLAGEKEFERIKIPADRSWYRTEKPEFLGTDKSVSIH